MVELIRTTVFDAWMRALRDRQAIVRIAARIDRLASGDPGDVKPIGGGLSELRIDHALATGSISPVAARSSSSCSAGATRRHRSGTSTGRRRWPPNGRSEPAMTEQKFGRYDSADYLETEADIAAYLDAVMAERDDDPAYVTRALGVVARARNISQLARDTGMSREGIYKALSDDGNPSFVTVARIARALGLRIAFEPARPDT
jgi:probable addiction module antidote protein